MLGPGLGDGAGVSSGTAPTDPRLNVSVAMPTPTAIAAALALREISITFRSLREFFRRADRRLLRNPEFPPLRREEHVSLLDTRINGDNHLPRSDTAAPDDEADSAEPTDVRQTRPAHGGRYPGMPPPPRGLPPPDRPYRQHFSAGIPGGGPPGSGWTAGTPGGGSDGAALTSANPLVSVEVPTAATIAAAAATCFRFIVGVPPRLSPRWLLAGLAGYAEDTNGDKSPSCLFDSFRFYT
jgi:hypothetical protein